MNEFSSTGVFPEASKDSVIQISNMVIRQGERDPFIRNVFTLNTCAPIVGSQVLSFSKEADMLKVGETVLVHFISMHLFRL